MHVVLGSQSPRRKEILSFFSLPFEQVSPDFDEEAVPFSGDPSAFVNVLSNGKANSLKGRFPESIIITADTILFKDGKIYGKPKSTEEGHQILRELSGNWHSVFTGVTVRKGDEQYWGFEETEVLFHTLTSEQIHCYHERLHCGDKAGGYTVQQAGSLVVKSIKGCYYNAVGLPIHTLKELLAKVGVDLWNFLPAAQANSSQQLLFSGAH